MVPHVRAAYVVAILILWSCGSGGGGGGSDIGAIDTPGPAADVPAPGVVATLPDGHAVIDVVAAFLEYAERGAGADEAARAALWDELLEARYPAFFAAAIYRGLEGAERESYKASVIAQFWSDIVPNLAALRAVHEGAAALVVDGRAAFEEQFPGFAPDCDYYLTVSFSFAGKVVELEGRTVFVIGLESFAADEPELAITIAHEQFHLYHFATFSAQGGLYRGVWAEGLATYASAMVVPGYRLSQYLGFPVARMNAIYDQFDALVADVLTNMSTSDQAVKRAYLGVEDNELGIPPGAGYYIGFYVAEALAEERSLPELARLDADTVYREMERVLPTLHLE